MGFNEEQRQAILAGIDEDILITAGAGSGKTKTLSERVYRLISDPEIGLAPSELLVLTFTNNAAFEMKTRIIARFASEGEEKADLASEMVSAHIQTIDSFNQYLVSTYSDRLGLPQNLKIADPTVLAVKEKEALETVLQAHYERDDLRPLMADLVRRNSWKDDRSLRNQLLSAYHEIRKWTPMQQRAFHRDADEYFLSEPFLEEAYRDYVQQAKEELTRILYRAWKAEGEWARGGAEALLSEEDFWARDVHHFAFADGEYTEPAYRALLELLDAESVEEFFRKVASFPQTYQSLFPAKTRRPGQADDRDRLDAAWKVLKDAYGRQDSLINRLLLLPSLEEALAARKKDEPLYRLFFTLLRCFEREMKDIKRNMGAYDFSDISSFALELLTAPEYADVAEEVRSRFRYIMIDEFQDTNDAQSVLLDSLLKPNKEGKRAHLFCVGDAKQSIYGFRDSNVELFRQRQNAYLDGQGHRVIAMNKNYRSGPGLLSDINYVFSSYMTMERGGIDYSSEMERLHYDRAVDLYREPYSRFGIERIVPPCPLSPLIREADYEARAIAEDIREKVSSGYLVYDRGSTPHLRPCRYGDFVILMRTKRNFLRYQKFFSELGIKLNNAVSENLREVGAIVLLQSLLGLVVYFLGETSIDASHLFVSYLRSYVAMVEDERILSALWEKDASPEERFASFPEWQKIKAFALAHEHSPFRVLFLDLLTEFGVLDKLVRVGEVGDVLSKIDSMYQTAASADDIGTSVGEFYEMLMSIARNRLELPSETLIQNDDAVDLMTIHASKGLEQKIVYLPTSDSGMGQPWSLKDGALISKRYGYSMMEDFKAENFMDFDEPSLAPVYALPGELSFAEHRRKIDIDEHARILYVALTRAENTVVLVGDSTKKKNGSVYEMMESCPSRYVFDRAFLERKAKEGAISQEDVSRYLESCVPEKETIERLDSSSWNEQAREVYDASVKERLAQGKIENEQVAKEISLALFRSYFPKVASLSSNPDALCSLLFLLDHPGAKENIASARDYFEFLAKRALPEDEEALDENDAEEEEEANEGENVFGPAKSPASFHRPLPLGSFDEFLDALPGVAEDLCVEDLTSKGVPGAKTYKRVDYSLSAFVSYFDHVPFRFGKTYATPGYQDRRIEYAYAHVDAAEKKEEAVPEFPISDEKISLPPRLHERASKRIVEEDAPETPFLDRGTFLHRLLELVDFSTFDTSFILDSNDRSLIERVLALPCIQEAKGAEVFPEYGYYDPDLATTGYIDLLYRKNGRYVIVDYKTSSLDDPSYEDQLRAYARNVARIFALDPRAIDLYLVSISRARARKVDL